MHVELGAHVNVRGYEEAHTGAGVKLKMVRTLQIAAGIGTAGEGVAILLVVVEPQIDAPEAGLHFRNHTLRGRRRVKQSVKVVKHRAVRKARVVRLARLEGKLTAKTQARSNHDATAQIHEGPIEAGGGIKVASAEGIDALPSRLGISAGGADVDIQTALCLGAGNAYERDQEHRQVLI